MAHFHAYNPWANTLIYIPSIAEAVGEEKEAKVFSQYGQKVDAYLLASPDGLHSFGIRYGKKGAEYLSPPINAEHAENLIQKYKEAP